MTNKFVISKKGLNIKFTKGLENIIKQIKNQKAVRIGSAIIALTMIGSAATACSNINGASTPNITKMTDSTIPDATEVDPTNNTTKEPVVEVDNEVLKVNIDDYKTMITPSFTTTDAIDSYTIDNMSIIGNQYYADLSTDEFILTSPKNVELITKGEEYSASKSEFTNALLEIGGQVDNCALDMANYATVDGVTNETFIVYDTKSNDNTEIDANSKILTTDEARVEYKTISEDDYKSIDSERYYLGIISIGPKDVILDGAKIVSTIDGTDDILVAGKSEEYGLCLFKTTKHNVVLENVVDASETKPTIDGTTINFTGKAYINYKFCYETIYHQVNSITVTKDGMFYCYGSDPSGNVLLTIIPSNLCSVEMDQTTVVLPEQPDAQLYEAPALAFTQGTYTYGPCCLTTNTLKQIEDETYIYGNSIYFGGDYKGKSFFMTAPNYGMYDLDSCAVSTYTAPSEVTKAISPINFILKDPKGSFSTTQLNLPWGKIVTNGVTLSNIGSKETYMVETTLVPSDGDAPYNNYTLVPVNNLIAKGSDTDLQKILKKN